MRVRWGAVALFCVASSGCETPRAVEPCPTNQAGAVPPRGEIVSQLGTSKIEEWAGGPEGHLALYDGATVRIYDPDRELVLAEHDATGAAITALSWRDANTLRLRTRAGTVLWEWRTGRARLALPSALSKPHRSAEFRPTPFGSFRGYEGPKGPSVVVSERDVLGDDDTQHTISHFEIRTPALDATVVRDRVFVTLGDATEVFTHAGKSAAKLPACTYVEASSDGSLVALELEIGASHFGSGCGEECYTNLRNAIRSGPERHEVHVYDVATLKPIAKFSGRSAKFRPGHRELYYLGPSGPTAKKGVTSASLMKWSGGKAGEKVVDVPDVPFSGDSDREVGRSTTWSSDGEALVVGKRLWRPRGTSFDEIAMDFDAFHPAGDLILQSETSLDIVSREGEKRFHFDKPKGTWDCDVDRRDLTKHPVTFCQHSDAIVRLSAGKPGVAIPKTVDGEAQLPCLLPRFLQDRTQSPDARIVASRSAKGIELTMRDGGAKRRLDHWSDVETFTWSPTSNLIAASAGRPEKTRVWDAETGQLLVEVDGKHPRWSTDGRTLYALGELSVSVWESGGAARSIALPKRRRFGGVHPAAAGTFVAVSNELIELWDGATGSPKLETPRSDPFGTPPDLGDGAVAVSADGRHVAILSSRGAAIDVYETATLRHVQSFAGVEGSYGMVFWHPTRPVVGVVAPRVGTVMYRLGDARRLWLRAKVSGTSCARAYNDDEGRFDAEPDGFSMVAVRVGPDAATANLLTKGPLFERHLQPRLADLFIGVE